MADRLARRRFEGDSRRVHHGRRCATCTQFYTDAEGGVHPIRNSPGYEAGVEAAGHREREHHRQAVTYGRGISDRHVTTGVQRPSWAAGISDRNLTMIARAHGANPFKERWWDRVNLVSGEGELRYQLEGGSVRGGGRMAQRQATKAETAVGPKRIRAALARSASQDFSDIPF